MTVQHLTMILQNYCHEGGALDEVEVYDKAGNKLCAIEDITLEKSTLDEKVKIIVHPRTIEDAEQYAEERQKEIREYKESKTVVPLDEKFLWEHDGAGVGINSEYF